MTNYQELKRLAEAATAGPWESTAWNEDRPYHEQEVKDLDYTAAASPDVTLQMIAEIARLRLHIKHIGNDALRTQNQALVEALKGLVGSTFVDSSIGTHRREMFENAQLAIQLAEGKDV